MWKEKAKTFITSFEGGFSENRIQPVFDRIESVQNDMVRYNPNMRAAMASLLYNQGICISKENASLKYKKPWDLYKAGHTSWGVEAMLLIDLNGKPSKELLQRRLCEFMLCFDDSEEYSELKRISGFPAWLHLKMQLQRSYHGQVRDGSKILYSIMDNQHCAKIKPKMKYLGRFI